MHASSMLKALVALAAAVSPAVAELAVSEPIGSTVCRGGEVCNVSWREEGGAPSLEDLGLCTIGLFTGGQQQQTFLQPIAFPDGIDVFAQRSIEFVVDPTVGPDDDNYFIRFTSLNHTQSSAPTSPPSLAFSAKFRLTGMRGTFNQTVLDQIASASSASASSTRSTASPTSRASTTRSAATTSSTTEAPNGAVQLGSSAIYAVGAAAFAGLITLF